ncbi:LysR family transcriptional regulator [Alkalibacterium kapii]|uniref:LysR family transcriptional regulator n=1 Tax=Alkalibacterium kapii TaxID=426704 RepID=A0A511ATY1_9LACT|nr:LysR family transcriptional regulator [Alkalibacterium kapii]GEK91648.1 LysR family transcriptional regulator [Alkalibacterium kapii]
MLDYRIYTFLKLCDTMNYHRTAEQLHMSQPAVTQHIHFLEDKYKTKLFIYDGKKLKKTTEALKLETYARAAMYNEEVFRKEMKNNEQIELRIGATKTIGEYVITEQIKQYLNKENHTLSLIIDNTEHLLHLLEQNKINFALIEGFFNKEKYNYSFYKEEDFVGVCSKDHPFANRKISLEELFKETLIVREKGSGTREIFLQILNQKNHTLESFEKTISISSFKVIKELIAAQGYVSFAYESIVKNDKNLASFHISAESYKREFNYVYLKNTKAMNYISMFQNDFHP